MLKDFKEFAMRGNVVDMAVGIIIGAAFGTIVNSLVSDVIMPPIGLLLGNIDFSISLSFSKGCEGGRPLCFSRSSKGSRSRVHQLWFFHQYRDQFCHRRVRGLSSNPGSQSD